MVGNKNDFRHVALWPCASVGTKIADFHDMVQDRLKSRIDFLEDAKVPKLNIEVVVFAVHTDDAFGFSIPAKYRFDMSWICHAMARVPPGTYPRRFYKYRKWAAEGRKEIR